MAPPAFIPPNVPNLPKTPRCFPNLENLDIPVPNMPVPDSIIPFIMFIVLMELTVFLVIETIELFKDNNLPMAKITTFPSEPISYDPLVNNTITISLHCKYPEIDFFVSYFYQLMCWC